MGEGITYPVCLYILGIIPTGKGRMKKKEVGNNNLLMKLNKKLGSKYFIITICSVAAFIMFFLCNYFINLFIHIEKKEFSVSMFEIKNLFRIDFKYIFSNKFVLIVYLVVLIFIAVMVLKLAYQIHTSFTDMNIGQKGTSRWTTTEEIKAQFKEVPDMELSFPGHGGLPIAHMGDKLYIDDSNTNVIAVGITRSGKDEIYLVPMIDVNSRAEEKPSMVILDMKLETISRSYKTLVQRGYEVQLLNIENPNIGIQYNPLSLIVKYYKNGKKSDAEILCNSFGYSIFSGNSSNSSDNTEFFLSNATSAVAALIIAHITDCDEEDKRENAQAQILFTQKQLEFEKLSEVQKKTAIVEYFNNEIKEFTVNSIKKTSYIPQTVKFIPTHKNMEKVTMYSIVNTFQNLA